jgi:hypothetical protein
MNTAGREMPGAHRASSGLEPGEPELPRPLSKPAALLIVLVLLLPWGVVLPVILRGPHEAATTGQRTGSRPASAGYGSPLQQLQMLAPGPWGVIEARRIEVAIPEEFLWVSAPTDYQPKWYFTGFTSERLVEFFRAMPLTEEQRYDLLRPSRWQLDEQGARVHPSLHTVLNLSTNARSRIYAQLVHSWEEQSQRYAVPYLPQEIEQRLAQSRLAPAAQALIRRLLYPRGEWLMFGDMTALLASLADEPERAEVVRVFSRHATYLLTLRVTPQSNLDELTAYWSIGGHRKDLRPLLESLARVPGGSTIDLVHLLPPMPRRRLYTYPYHSLDPVEERRDCHWTSVNFFNDPADDRFTDAATVSEHIRTSYEPVSDRLRFGDLILLYSLEGTAVHSAVYIAADMVFTKNGGHFFTPWSFMRLDEMLRFYNALFGADGGVEQRVYRLKSLADVNSIRPIRRVPATMSGPATARPLGAPR